MASPPRPVMTHVNLIPKIGGMPLGAAAAAGTPPLANLSYQEFRANDAQLGRYWPEVPCLYLASPTSALAPDTVQQWQGLQFVTAVCPCSGLSGNNTATKGANARGAGAAKNLWMVETARLVLGQLRPRVFVGENAAELATPSGREVVERLAEVGRVAGYSMSLVKTCTSLHGLPQRRVRTFYFFWRSARPPVLPWLAVSRPPLAQHLAAIPAAASQQDLYIHEGRASARYRPYQFLLEREGVTHQQFYAKMAEEFPTSTITVAKLLEKRGLMEECVRWLKARFPKEGWTRGGKPHHAAMQAKIDKLRRKLGYWDDSIKFMGTCFTGVIKKNLLAVHPVEDRFLSVRELLHLMGMPHDFQLDDVKNFNHICQTVPVDTARAWVDQVVAYCTDPAAFPTANTDILVQNNLTRKLVERGRGLKRVASGLEAEGRDEGMRRQEGV